MPLNSMPAIDAAYCSGWTEQDINLYNQAPFFFAKMQVEHRKWWPTWEPLMGKRKWQANQGPTMRIVGTEPSPNLRQEAFPSAICDPVKKDVMDIRERKVDASVKYHDFESPVFNFCPDFRDFMTHIKDNVEDIETKIERFEDIFYRTNVFHQSPNVWITDRAAGELVAAPTGDGDAAGTSGKTIAWRQSIIPALGQPGNLSLCTLVKLATVAETDLGIAPFRGSGKPRGMDSGLDNVYVLITSAEAFNQFTFDPYLLAHKDHNLNVVNNSFKGLLFGRITTKLEALPLRMALDGTFPQPEVREANPAVENYGETLPNSTYTGAPLEWAWFVGAKGYDVIEVGPPPALFASEGMPKGFGKMTWNGEVVLTKNVLVPCYDQNGVLTWETNKYGKYLQAFAEATFGIVGHQKRNIIPILFKRVRGCANEAV